MTTTTFTKAALLEKLADLENRFSDLSPELELTVRDPELGVEGYVVVWTTLTAVGGPLGRCGNCLLYTSPSPRDATLSRMPSSA